MSARAARSNRRKRPAWLRARFSLRLLGAIVLIFAVLFAWLSAKVHQHRQRVDAQHQLADCGVAVSTEWPAPTALESGWLFSRVCDLLGEEPPFEVTLIHMESPPEGRSWTDEDFALLGHFPETNTLWIESDHISARGIEHITSISGALDLIIDCDSLEPSHRAFEDLGKLQYLHLRCDTVGDPLLRNMCSLAHLQHLELRATDSLPLSESLSKLEDLPRLEVLRLVGLPRRNWSELPKLPGVVSLSLASPRPELSQRDDADVVDLAFLQRLPNLNSLALHRAGAIDDRQAAQLSRHGRLTSLDLQGSSISDEAVAEIATLPLECLSLEHSNVSDRAMQYVGAIKPLCVLDISHTSISDEGLRHLEQIPELEVLEIDRTSISNQARFAFFRNRPDCDDRMTFDDWAF